MPPKSTIQPDKLRITVNDASVVGNEARYRVAIMDPLRPRVAIHTVDRTYNQLKPIMKKFQEVDPMLCLPEVPKKMFGALEPAFIEDQRSGIERYLNAVADSKLLCYDVDFLAYVGYDSAAKERLMRTQLLLELNHSRTLHACFTALLFQPRADEGSVTAARCWLRNRDDYTFVQGLPAPTHPKWPCRKAAILVEDTARVQYILTIQPIKETSILFEASLEKVKRVRQMMQRLNSTIFSPLVDMDVVEGNKLISVRRIHNAGSLTDFLHDAPSPIDSNKFAYVSKGLPLSRLHQAANETLKIIRACHEHGFSVPNLLMGNLLVNISNDRITLSLGGWEDVLAGNSWLPLQAVEFSEEGPNKTHLDVLLFGAILYQLSTGTVLAPDALEALLMCQGEPFDEGQDEVAITPQHHILTQSMLVNCPAEVASLLHYIFHPTIPADIRILVHHSFLRVRNTIVEADGALYAAPAGEGALAIKKKDLELIKEEISLWEQEWENKASRRDARDKEDCDFALKNSKGTAGIIEKKKQSRKSMMVSTPAIPEPGPPAPSPTPTTVHVSTGASAPNMPSFAPQNHLAPPPPVVMSNLSPNGVPLPPPPPPCKTPPPPVSKAPPPPPPPPPPRPAS